MASAVDDDVLPAEDICCAHLCGRPEAEHGGEDGVWHSFKAPAPKPKPERIAGCDIVTSWHCTHCGEACEVEGVACDEWMECSSCLRYSFLRPGFGATMSAVADTVSNHG